MAHVTLPGINWRNLNPLAEDAFTIFEAGGFETAVVMSNLGAGLPLEIARRKPAALLIGRLFRGGPDLPTVDDAVNEWSPYIQATRGVIKHFQIDNESPINYPAVSAADFSTWWLRVLRRLREKYPGLLWGFPAPPPGPEAIPYMEACREAVEAADWISTHCYWEEI